MMRTKQLAYGLLALAGLATLFGGKLVKPVYAQVKATMVRDIDNPALQPVQFQINLTATGGNPQYNGYAPAVPFGKRLVIETISIVDSDPGTAAGVLNLFPALNGNPALFNVPMQYNSVLHVATGTLRTKLYADAGNGTYFQYEVQHSTDANKTVSISGYYINN